MKRSPINRFPFIKKILGFSLPDVIIATAITGTFVSAAIVISSNIADMRVESHTNLVRETSENLQKKSHVSGAAAHSSLQQRVRNDEAHAFVSNSRFYVDSNTSLMNAREVGRLSVTGRLLSTGNSKMGITTKSMSYVIGDPVPDESGRSNKSFIDSANEKVVLDPSEESLRSSETPELWIYSEGRYVQVSNGSDLNIDPLTDIYWNGTTPQIQVKLTNLGGSSVHTDFFTSTADGNTPETGDEDAIMIPLDEFLTYSQDPYYHNASTGEWTVPGAAFFDSNNNVLRFDLHISPIIPHIRQSLSKNAENDFTVRLSDMLPDAGFGEEGTPNRLVLRVSAQNENSFPFDWGSSGYFSLSSDIGGTGVSAEDYIPVEGFASAGANPTWSATFESDHPLVRDAEAEVVLSAIPVTLPDAIIENKFAEPITKPEQTSLSASLVSGWGLPSGTDITQFYKLQYRLGGGGEFSDYKHKLTIGAGFENGESHDPVRQLLHVVAVPRQDHACAHQPVKVCGAHEEKRLGNQQRVAATPEQQQRGGDPVIARDGYPGVAWQSENVVVSFHEPGL